MRLLAPLVLASALTAPLAATTVIAPTFEELVAKARTIFVGETVDTRAAWETTREGRHIVTIVTFDVSRVIKGSVGLRTQLTFAGGRIADVAQEIAGMPKFRVGDRDVLFVSGDGNTVSPLVALWHGRFRLQPDPDGGERFVRSFDGKPLLLGLDMRGRGASLSRGPLRLSEFESAVRQRASTSDRNQR